MEDAGALVFEAPVDNLAMGDVIEIRPYDGKILHEAVMYSPSSNSSLMFCWTKCAPVAAST